MATPLADWSVARVTEFRGVVGLSQMALAERIGLSRPTLAKIESGERARPSTVKFLVTRLEEEFGDLFDYIELEETSPSNYELRFEKKELPSRRERLRQPLEWTHELNALSRKVIEITSHRNAHLLPTFHEELIEIIVAYVRLSGLAIAVARD